MKILFITHRLPCPPDRGCKVRSAAILHWLARRHDVWCAGFLDNDSKEKGSGVFFGDGPEGAAHKTNLTSCLGPETHSAMASLRELCHGFLAIPFRPTLAGYRGLARLVTGGTATEGYFASRALREGVLAWSRDVEFDAVFAFSSGMAPLALQVPAERHVLCMDDLDSRKWQELGRAARWPMSLIYSTEARRLAKRELQWVHSFEASVMVAQREADLIEDPGLRAKVHVVPPALPPMSASSEPLCPVANTGPVVGFVGAMDYEPNVDAACWMAREIWPRIRTCRSDARLMLVGRSPVQAVRDLASDSTILVTGTVPDVNSYLSGMRVHVAPLRVSRGVQIKVVSAMAAGRPCVVTSCVAEGLSARAGRDLLVADSPAGLAAAVNDLLDDPRKAQAIGRAGQRFIKQFDTDRVMGRLECLLSGEPERCEEIAPEIVHAARRTAEAAA